MKLCLGQNAIVIGRFQGLHYAHQKIIETALHVAPNVIIVIGSVNQPRTPRNPFTFEERRELILCNLQHIPNIQNRLVFIGLEDDLYNDNKWRLNFFEKLNLLKIDITKSIIVGSNKDSSSDFLKILAKDIPLHLIDIQKTDTKKLYNATSIRKWFFELNKDITIAQTLGASQQTIDWLLLFKNKNANDFIDLTAQFAYFQEYKRKLKNYPIICQATDAVVTKGNKILLITRGHYPGKNLLALPGGFVEENLTLETNCLKELQEETNMNISYDALRTYIKASKTFDNPTRSERCRIITTAFHIDLTRYTKDIAIFPGDDANGVGWWDLSEVLKRREQFFEDHLDIIRAFV